MSQVADIVISSPSTLEHFQREQDTDGGGR